MMDMDLTDVTVVLDRSGSMAPMTLDVIGGMNQFYDDQRSQPGRCALSLVLFDHLYEAPYEAMAIAHVPVLTHEVYWARGSTALLDALGTAIARTGERLSALPEAERPSKVLFVIYTDGLENASKRYTRSMIAALIKQQTEAYNWQFVFMAANQDAITAAGALNIPAQHAATVDAAAVGSTVRAMSATVAGYRSTGRVTVTP